MSLSILRLFGSCLLSIPWCDCIHLRLCKVTLVFVVMNHIGGATRGYLSSGLIWCCSGSHPRLGSAHITTTAWVCVRDPVAWSSSGAEMKPAWGSHPHPPRVPCPSALPQVLAHLCWQNGMPLAPSLPADWGFSVWGVPLGCLYSPAKCGDAWGLRSALKEWMGVMHPWVGDVKEGGLSLTLLGFLVRSAN